MTWLSPTGADGFTTPTPSTVTRPSAISFAAWVRERARPRFASAASKRSGRVAALQAVLQLVVQLRERCSPRLERLVLDHEKAREERIRLGRRFGGAVAHAHEYSSTGTSSA